MTLAELLDRCAPRPSRQGDLLIAVCREIIPSVCGLPAPAPITSFKPGMSLVRPLEGLPDEVVPDLVELEVAVPRLTLILR